MENFSSDSERGVSNVHVEKLLWRKENYSISIL
jgi:hypothetical protein